MTIYLRKDSDEVLSFCRCPAEEALIAHPGQISCPWCGCGFLFSCWKCRKAFTFARAIESPLTIEELARRDIANFRGDAVWDGPIRGWVDDMKEFLEKLTLGERYVYLDGHAHRADASSVVFTGWYGKHALAKLPHLEAGASGDTMCAVLDRKYWQKARELAKKESA